MPVNETVLKHLEKFSGTDQVRKDLNIDLFGEKLLDSLASIELVLALSERTEAIREDERTSIARELHDDLGQSVTALKLDMSWLSRLPPPPPTVVTNSSPRGATYAMNGARSPVGTTWRATRSGNSTGSGPVFVASTRRVGRMAGNCD